MAKDLDKDGRLVASYAEAWIERTNDPYADKAIAVASYAEAWIESKCYEIHNENNQVASYAEAWIERSG